LKAENIFLLLNSDAQEAFFNIFFLEIRNSNPLDKAVEPDPEPIERTMMVLNLTEGLRITEAGFRFSDYTDCNEERSTAAGQRYYDVDCFLVLRRF
jgi:hypothetical protein